MHISECSLIFVQEGHFKDRALASGPCTFWDLRQIPLFENRALASTPCIFSTNLHLPRQTRLWKIALSPRRRAHFGLVLGSLGALKAYLGLSWGFLGVVLGCFGIGLGCLRAVLTQQTFFVKSCSRFGAVHISCHRKTTFSRNPAPASTPCIFSGQTL